MYVCFLVLLFLSSQSVSRGTRLEFGRVRGTGGSANRVFQGWGALSTIWSRQVKESALGQRDL